MPGEVLENVLVVLVYQARIELWNSTTAPAFLYPRKEVSRALVPFIPLLPWLAFPVWRT
jgi:hypothetical protein